jgi:hypothetical protein
VESKEHNLEEILAPIERNTEGRVALKEHNKEL